MTRDEPHDVRIRRLAMRSARRGTREMDLILGDFAARELACLNAETLDLYEALLGESDHDLYQWVSGQAPSPDRYAALVARIAAAPGQTAAG